MQQKTLNWIFKTPSHQEQMILSSSINEKTYLQGFLEGVLEAIQVFLKPLVISTRSLDDWISSSKLFTKREREERREFSQGLHGHLEL